MGRGHGLKQIFPAPGRFASKDAHLQRRWGMAGFDGNDKRGVGGIPVIRRVVWGRGSGVWGVEGGGGVRPAPPPPARCVFQGLHRIPGAGLTSGKAGDAKAPPPLTEILCRRRLHTALHTAKQIKENLGRCPPTQGRACQYQNPYLVMHPFQSFTLN